MTKKRKTLSEIQKHNLECRIMKLLFAGIDYCQNTSNGREFWFSPNNPYTAEAFGLLQALEVLGYGYFGPDNRNDEVWLNLRFWFNSLKDNVKPIAIEMGEHESYIWSKYNLNEKDL